MYISTKDWNNFIGALSKLNQASADAIVKYVNKYGFGDTDALVGYAKRVVDLYGNASASLAAQMYDEIAELEGKFYEPAELADTPDYGEVAKTVYGVLKTSENPKEMGGAVSRLVKRTGQDTLLQNGIRDGAEFAWIPNGDTCPFCLTLASRGWQKISKKALKNGHAEHIHSNCNCSYMIRHSDDVDVAGYEPEKYYEMYQNAEGKTPNEKINYMRRMQNAEKRNDNKRGYDVLAEYKEDATPKKGNIDYGFGYDKSKNKNEIATANIIFDTFGGNIKLKSEIQGQKNPDYEWNGRFWDLKTTSSEKAANSAIKSGMKQIRSNPGGIILNFNDVDFSMDELRNVIDTRMHWYPKDIVDIMVISKGKVLNIFRY